MGETGNQCATSRVQPAGLLRLMAKTIAQRCPHHRRLRPTIGDQPIMQALISHQALAGQVQGSAKAPAGSRAALVVRATAQQQPQPALDRRALLGLVAGAALSGLAPQQVRSRLAAFPCACSSCSCMVSPAPLLEAFSKAPPTSTALLACPNAATPGASGLRPRPRCRLPPRGRRPARLLPVRPRRQEDARHPGGGHQG